MDQSRSGSENEPFAKRRKSNSEGYENETFVAFDQEQTADIFKLDLDCFQEAFDYLRFEKLDALAGTCKWLQKVAGHCYRHTFSDKVAQFTPDKVVSKGKELAYLIKFLRYAKIGSQNGFYNFLNYQSKCLQLTSLELFNIKITRSQLDGMKEVLTKLHFLYFVNCQIGKYLHDILALTPNLKHLNLCMISSNARSEWLKRRYPTLERFEFISGISFLQLNSNIRIFGTPLENLWENRQLIKTAKVVLDDLAILVHYSTSDITKTFELNCQLLNELHELGLYKRLKMYGDINQKMVGHMTSLNTLVKLHTKWVPKISLSSLTQLEEIIFESSDRVEDLTAIANNLKNLEKISFNKAIVPHIMPFIRHAAKLEEIHIGILTIEKKTFVENNIYINLSSLNNEREKLQNAKKVTIYVNESVYLNIKCKQQTDIGLVKLKRNNFNNWKHDFSPYLW